MARRRIKNYDLLSKYNGYTPGWGGTLALLGLALAGQLLGGIINIGLNIFMPQEYSMMIAYPIMFLPAMYFCSAKSINATMFDNSNAHPIDEGRFKPMGVVKLIPMVMIATMASAIAIEPFLKLINGPLVKLMPHLYEAMKASMALISDAPVLVSLITTAVLAPFFEEWLCRGMVLRGMLKHTNPTTAIIVSSLFFAIIHLNPWQAVPAFVLGCIFGLVYYKTGSLKLTMLMHATNNAMSVILSSIPSLKDYEFTSDAFTNPAIYWAMVCSCLAIVVAFALRIVKTNFSK